jgi:hypothetical protein
LYGFLVGVIVVKLLLLPEDRRRILEENPHISKDALEFVLSLPVERKILKVMELETIHATA